MSKTSTSTVNKEESICALLRKVGSTFPLRNYSITHIVSSTGSVKSIFTGTKDVTWFR